MRASLLALLAGLAISGCIGPEDNPSQVRDLRVLGVALDPPELMRRPEGGGAACVPNLEDPLSSDPLVYLQEVEYRALIADPAGAGRALDYQLWACADLEDRDCQQAEQRVLLAEGTTAEGELVLRLRPATAQLPDGTPLLQLVAGETGITGAFTLWLPLVLKLTAGTEEIYAQKLLVLSCAWFPQMQANLQPTLPGILAGESPLPTELRGPGPHPMRPIAFEDRQEPYVLVGLADPPEPVNLIETWKVAWYTDVGAFSPNQTGGTDPSGGSARHNVEWIPPAGDQERQVRFWFVVRDGRGGLSWLTHSARYLP